MTMNLKSTLFSATTIVVFALFLGAAFAGCQKQISRQSIKTMKSLAVATGNGQCSFIVRSDCSADASNVINLRVFLFYYRYRAFDHIKDPNPEFDWMKNCSKQNRRVKLYYSLPDVSKVVDCIYEDVWDYKKYFESSKDRQLCKAIATRNPKKISAAIRSGCDPNAVGVDGMPILFWAYFYGDDVVEALLKNGANPNVVLKSNYDIDSLFHIPGSSLLYTTIVFSTFQGPDPNFFHGYPELLLKYGADPNFNDESPLTLALRWHGKESSLVQALLDKGADVSRIDGRYRLGSPLLSSAARYDFGTVVELLNRGATTDANEFTTRELQRAVCSYKSDYDAASDEERANATQYENYVKTVEALAARGISCEEPLPFETEFEKMHSRYWNLFGLDDKSYHKDFWISHSKLPKKTETPLKEEGANADVLEAE